MREIADGSVVYLRRYDDSDSGGICLLVYLLSLLPMFRKCVTTICNLKTIKKVTLNHVFGPVLGENEIHS